MRILYLAHRVPYPPNKGDKIRSFHQLEFLSRHHSVDLLAFCDNPSDLDHAERLEQYCSSVKLIRLNSWRQRASAGRAMILGRPWTFGYFECGKMKSAVREHVETAHPDLAFVFSSSMAQYAAELPLPKILDFVDSDAAKWGQYAAFKPVPWRWLYLSESRRLLAYEHSMTESFDAAVFVSSREADQLRLAGLADKIKFIQNGVDLNYFRPPVEPRRGDVVIFTGAMDYYPNVDAVAYFAARVLPLIRRQNPQVEFQVVGSRPAAAVRRLARLPGVTVTGGVKDVRPYLAAARVAVAPLRISQGVQNKVLEALAMGLPVVASRNAVSGICEVGRLPIDVAEDVEQCAAYVLERLGAPSFTPAEVEICRKELERLFDWERNLMPLELLLQECCQSGLT